MKTKHTTLTTLALITTLTLTACGHEERPQNPTYNPADSTYTTLPTKQLSPENAFQTKAINICQNETARQTRNPENTITNYNNFDLSDIANNQGTRAYLLTGETTVTENGTTTEYTNTCVTDVKITNEVDLITVYIAPTN